MFISSLLRGRGISRSQNSKVFRKSNFYIFLPILVIVFSYLVICMCFYFLSFVCFVSLMSEYDALLASSRSF